MCSNKSHLNKRLLGISAKDVVLLESKTRNVVKKWDLKSLLGWKVDESNGSLCLLFSESSFLFLCESGTAREHVQDTIKQCVYQRNCEVSQWRLLNDAFTKMFVVVKSFSIYSCFVTVESNHFIVVSLYYTRQVLSKYWINDRCPLFDF